MEQEQGWDPEVKKYFRKIMSTIGYGLLWLMTVLTAGFYFGLAYRREPVLPGPLLLPDLEKIAYLQL